MPICSWDEAFTAVIPNGRLATSNCYVVTPDNKRLRDLEYDCPAMTLTELPPPDHIDGTVATLVWGWNLPHHTTRTHNIFGHWFFDILPRIHLLEKSGVAIDHYIIGKLHYPFQYESLKMIGIPMHKVIEVEKLDFHMTAKILLAPAVPVVLGKCPPWASSFIVDRLKHDQHIPKASGYERIYITREDTPMRHVANEDEVWQLLQPLGFRKIVLTPLTTAEKIAIFSCARTIVAPYGSGSINVAFCEPGASYIELSLSNVTDNYFWKLCGHAGVRFFELICPIEQPPKPIAGTDNMIVDIAKLTRLLQLAGV
nr:glycosyltransferase 61 family protein [Paenibacillus sp. NEAU-GSW1]